MAKSKMFKKFKDDDGSEITWEGDFCLFKQMIAFDPVKRPSVNDVLEHISQVRSSLQKAEVNGLDQPGQSEEVNVAENRDSTPTEEADTPRGETRASLLVSPRNASAAGSNVLFDMQQKWGFIQFVCPM